MRVIEGGFGKEDSEKTLTEVMAIAVANSDMEDMTGVKFTLTLDAGEKRTFLTNYESASDAVFALELVKHIILGG